MIAKCLTFALVLLTGCVDTEVITSSVVLNPSQDVNRPSENARTTDLSNNGAIHFIRNNPGGRVLPAEIKRRQLLNWGGPVRIEGYCHSACAIFTTLPNACLAPRTRIGFHSSSINYGPVGNAQIARYLRGGVAAAYLEEWQFVPNDSLYEISAEDYVALDPKSKLCAA